jgi:hypothetical protein
MGALYLRWAVWLGRAGNQDVRQITVLSGGGCLSEMGMDEQLRLAIVAFALLSFQCGTHRR